jgi:hypothetical protein
MTISLKQITKMSLLALTLFGCTHLTYAIKLPPAYEAVVTKMTNNELVNRFHSLLRRETNPEDNNSKIRFWDDSSLMQLPIYRVATLKVIINEIKKRQESTKELLLPDSQITQAEKLIASKEAAMEKGIKAERERRR